MRLSLLVVPGVLAVLACGGQTGPTGPDPGDAELTARMNGETFVSVSTSVARQDGTITVSASATNPARMITFTIPDVGAATHVIGPTFPAVASATIQNQAWGAGGAAGGGTISVANVTASRIVGSFSLGLVALGGQQPATISVSQGVFDISF